VSAEVAQTSHIKKLNMHRIFVFLVALVITTPRNGPVTGDEFGHLVAMVLDAQSVSDAPLARCSHRLCELDRGGAGNEVDGR